MLEFVNRFYNVFINWLLSLNRQEWVLVLFFVMVLGFLCMRGLGQRKTH